MEMSERKRLKQGSLSVWRCMLLSNIIRYSLTNKTSPQKHPTKRGGDNMGETRNKPRRAEQWLFQIMHATLRCFREHCSTICISFGESISQSYCYKGGRGFAL
eukprot:5769997-Amphidinium_carterae.1